MDRTVFATTPPRYATSHAQTASSTPSASMIAVASMVVMRTSSQASKNFSSHNQIIRSILPEMTMPC